MEVRVYSKSNGCTMLLQRESRMLSLSTMEWLMEKLLRELMQNSFRGKLIALKYS